MNLAICLIHVYNLNLVMTLTKEELESRKNQITLRSEIENLKLDIESKKHELNLDDLISHFESSKEYAEKLKLDIESVKFDDYTDIDLTSEIEYLVRDHNKYSSTLLHIKKIEEFKNLLEKLEEKSKGLDY